MTAARFAHMKIQVQELGFGFLSANEKRAGVSIQKVQPSEAMFK